MKYFSQSELGRLRGLRGRFLSGDGAGDCYWEGGGDLELYDRTLAERIGWKWDAVLGELTARGWKPRGRHLVDFACGSGVASRRLLTHFPGQFDRVTLHDRSAAAMEFARERLQEQAPGIETAAEPKLERAPEGAVVAVSHVLNELSAGALEAILAVVEGAEQIVWVEAGTHVVSRRLVAEVRERLNGRFRLAAPCPHSSACGMLTTENARHWCHSFARPPSAVFQDAMWAEFAREMGIDLRALPYCYFVLDPRPPEASRSPALARVIGHPREYKGYHRVLTCREAGVAELTLQKRDAPELFKAVRDERSGPMLEIEERDGKIVAGAPAPS